MEPLERQVLILDDDGTFAEAARSVLRQLATYVEVASGPGAVNVARSIRWDLIVCALELLPLGGPYLKRQLARDPGLAGVPFLFVGQHSQDPSLPLGEDAPLRKPVDPSALLARARRLLPPPIAAHAEPAPDGQPPAVAATAAAGASEDDSELGSAAPAPVEVAPPAEVALEDLGPLQGGLDVVPLGDTLRKLESARADGALRISGVALAGELLLRQGRVVLARTNHRSGEDAALRLIWLREGRFQFDPLDPIALPPGPGWVVGHLLLEAAWLFQELTRLAERAPGVRDRIEVVDPEAAAAAFPDLPAWRNLLGASRAPLSIEDLAAELGVSTYRCRALVGKAAEVGTLRILPGR